MYWHRIAAAVAAAAAAFQEAGVLPASWRQRFPDARLKIHLRFNVVRILWAFLVMFHGRPSRFATQIIEVFFFFAQWWTVIHNSRLVRIRKRHSELFNDGTCTGGWFWIHSRNFSLMTTVNHFVDDCPNLNFLPSFLLHRSSLEVRVQVFHLGLIISTLEIALATILRDVLVLFECGECPSMQQSGLSLPLGFFVPSLWPPFIPFPLSPLHLESTLLGLKDLLFVLLGFPRHASLRDRSPESSEPYVTLDSSKVRWTEQHSELIRLSSHVLTLEYLALPGETSFFPCSHLRVSCTPGFWGLLEEFRLTDTLCRETRQHVLAFTFRDSWVKSFLQIFS